jgi:hypothetical protein
MHMDEVAGGHSGLTSVSPKCLVLARARSIRNYFIARVSFWIRMSVFAMRIVSNITALMFTFTP